MKYLLIMFPVLISSFSLAQSSVAIDKKTKGHITAKVSLPYHLNNSTLKQVSGTKRRMTVANTVGYRFEAGYEYTNKRNINLSGSLGYGMQKTDIAWNFNTKDVAPILPNENFTHQFIRNVNFWSLSVNAGYDYKPLKSKNTLIQAKIGAGFVSYIKGYEEIRYYILAYNDNTGPQTKLIANIDAEAGSDLFENTSVNFDKGLSIDVNPFYQCYLGIKAPLPYRRVKNYFLGITFTNTLSLNSKSAPFDITRSFYYDQNGNKDAIEIYENKFRSIALTAGIGF